MDHKISTNLERQSRRVPRIRHRIIELNPHLPGNGKRFQSFCRALARQLRNASPADRHRILGEARDLVQQSARGTVSQRAVALSFASSVTIDMVAQGWELSARRNKILLRAPSTSGASPNDLKERVRQGHLLERDAQLRIHSVRDFVAKMETRRLTPKGWTSIFSLMRDGRELADKLRLVAMEPEGNKKAEYLRRTISPYLQAVEAGVKCELTGMYLTDIWRYFRHTWVSSYKSLPGRSMMVLIRDAAAPFHPVIGIAALGSSMAQQSLRDRWIGWESDTFIQSLRSNPTAEMAQWMRASIDRLIRSIYAEDFLRARLVKKTELRTPTKATIDKLRQYANRAMIAHRQNPEAANHKNTTVSRNRPNWLLQAKTALFRSKRANTLARILEIRLAFTEAGASRRRAEAVTAIIASPKARSALKQLVRLVKAEHVGVDMMDIIVCGAIPPYNALLGGKLVCTLLCSPEIVNFYRSRYAKHSSIIASSMNGKSVVRPPNLVLLATTSLYGVGSSQYNRLRIPVVEAGGKTHTNLEFLELGISRGYGSYHFSQATIDYLETMLGRAGNGRKVNSIFGEGVNPLMRKIRDGLNLVGLSGDELLRHGNARVVYAVSLASNFREVLIGVAATPKYLLPLSRATATTQKLAEFWRGRWLTNRIKNPEILEIVEKHTLAYPITHGARVTLPPAICELG